MTDPIGAFETVKRSVIRYVATAFGTQHRGLELERRRLLESLGTFCQEPWIEPIPRFASSGLTVDALTREHVANVSDEGFAAFKQLVRCGLLGDYALYSHQLKMLERAASGQNCVVTAGTGSGKTECFLLPIFAYLANELVRQAQSQPSLPRQDDWWVDPERDEVLVNGRMVRSPRVAQRAHEDPTRHAAVRALILYPMNALVEDQLSRLRKSLDSPAARTWMADYANGNRIYFGRYNGATPVPGHELRATGNPDRQRIVELARRLQAAERTADEAARLAAEQNREEVRYFFPRLDGSEMRSRWDMQDAPPDILITNYSMLSIMLMRDADAPVFERTRRWLEDDPAAVFHLVVDELHLYRGTAGTEIAYLLRLVLHRLGLTPDDPRLRVLASSASLDTSSAATRAENLAFLEQFFGCEWTEEQVIPGQALPPEPVPEGDLAPGPFVDFLAGRQAGGGADAAEALTTALGSPVDEEAPDRGLAGAFEAGVPAVAARMIRACTSNDEARAVPASAFAQGVFGEEVEQEQLAMALRGLLHARESCGRSDILPRFRLHWLFRNIEGLWACVEPNCNCRADETAPTRPVGKLFAAPRDSCGAVPHAHRVRELLYCEWCGTLMIGGGRLSLEDGLGWELLGVDPDLAGVPDRRVTRLVERRSYDEYLVFWPAGTDRESAGTWRQPSLGHDAGEGPRAAWHRGALNTRTGHVRLGQMAEAGWSAGFVFVLQEEDDGARALPAICPNCAADYTRRVSRRSPIRGFRTGFARLAQLLTKEFMGTLPEDARKLVVFSDSREDAAALSNGIERNHYRDVVREVLHSQVFTSVVAEPALLAELEDFGAAQGAVAVEFARREPGRAETLRSLLNTAGIEIPEGLAPAAVALLQTARREAQEVIAEVRQRQVTRSLPLRMVLESQDGDRTSLIVRRLKELGINPGGNDKRFQFRRVDDRRTRWTELFDFSTPSGGWVPDLGDQAEDWRREFLAKVHGEACSVLFGRLYFGFEASGLGYVQLRVPEHVLLELAPAGCDTRAFHRACDSVLRVMGESYRFRQIPELFPTYDWIEWRSHVRRYVDSLGEHLGAATGQFRAATWSALCDAGGQTAGLLHLSATQLHIAQPNDPVWVCSQCQRPHQHHAGVCTRCYELLPEEPELVCADLRHNNYYARRVEDQADAARLHCEELSGQTDDQAARQRLFRDIVIEVNDPPEALESAVDIVDLLSVTTTLEVGVDIGTLQGVVQGNMPPTRFNYQQRVGRAGRAGQAFSTALTICRGRSHDEFYYRNPDRITGDPPPIPFLAMDREEIALRLMAKEVLRRAFLAAAVDWTESPTPPDSHGEFGLAEAWLEDAERRRQVSEVIEAGDVANETARVLCAGPHQALLAQDLATRTTATLAGKIDAASANPELNGEGLAERLAEAGILPMFGMPSRVRELYHGLAFEYARTVDRDLDLAITEFAPGAQKTKDKLILRAIGFTSPLLNRGGNWVPGPGDPLPDGGDLAVCGHCRATSPATGQWPVECPQCGAGGEEGFRVLQTRVPAAFRTNLEGGLDRSPDDDFIASAGYATMLAQYSPEDCELVDGTNSAVRLRAQGRVYRVNDRDGQLFCCQPGITRRRYPRTARVPSLNNQYIDERYLEDVGFTPTGDPEEFALSAPKTTDVLRLRPAAIPDGLRLNPLGDDAVKGAFYSVGFIIRTVAAHVLDIDPEEIELTSLESNQQYGVGELVLSDYLPNASGFVRWLHDHWAQLLGMVADPAASGHSYLERLVEPAAHVSGCATACYDCLQRYRNMNYHNVLDWRLGLAVARCLASDTYRAGLDGDFTSVELTGWIDSAAEHRDVFCAAFPQCEQAAFGPLPGLMVGQRQAVIAHPLWDTRAPRGLLADAVSSMDPGGRFLDTFNLARRQSWSYQSLAN